MKNKALSITVSLLIIGILTACNLPFGQQAQSGNNPEEVGTFIAQNVNASVTARFDLTNTAVAAFTSTPLPSATPTVFYTPSSTPYPTKETVWLEVNKDSNCRLGPANYYPLVRTLKQGEKLQVVGRDAFNGYFYVRDPEVEGSACWVWGKYVTITGDTNRVPVYTAIPTMTPTFTPTSAPGIALDYQSLTSCGTDFALRLIVHNTGSITWKSLRITVKDNTTSQVFVQESDVFQSYNGCSLEAAQKDLTFGEDSYIANYNPGQIPYDPTGNSMTVGVEVFSEDGLKGETVSRTISVTP
jgi:hypothetical protein